MCQKLHVDLSETAVICKKLHLDSSQAECKFSDTKNIIYISQKLHMDLLEAIYWFSALRANKLLA